MSGMVRYAITMELEEGDYLCSSTEVEGDNVPYDLISNTVQGYIERVGLVVPTTKWGPGFALDMWVNEEGFLRGLSPNPVASVIASTLRKAPVTIVGNVVFTSGDNDVEGNTIPLSKREAESVASMILNASMQLQAIRHSSL